MANDGYDLTKLGNYIAALRNERVWSQQDLADRAGGSLRQSDISRIERGEVRTRNTRLTRIAQAFGMSLDEFLSRLHKTNEVEAQDWAIFAGIAFGLASLDYERDVRDALCDFVRGWTDEQADLLRSVLTTASQVPIPEKLTEGSEDVMAIIAPPKGYGILLVGSPENFLLRLLGELTDEERQTLIDLAVRFRNWRMGDPESLDQALPKGD